MADTEKSQDQALQAAISEGAVLSKSNADNAKAFRRLTLGETPNPDYPYVEIPEDNRACISLDYILAQAKEDVPFLYLQSCGGRVWQVNVDSMKKLQEHLGAMAVSAKKPAPALQLNFEIPNPLFSLRLETEGNKGKREIINTTLIHTGVLEHYVPTAADDMPQTLNMRQMDGVLSHEISHFKGGGVFLRFMRRLVGLNPYVAESPTDHIVEKVGIEKRVDRNGIKITHDPEGLAQGLDKLKSLPTEDFQIDLEALRAVEIRSQALHQQARSKDKTIKNTH